MVTGGPVLSGLSALPTGAAPPHERPAPPAVRGARAGQLRVPAAHDGAGVAQQGGEQLAVAGAVVAVDEGCGPAGGVGGAAAVEGLHVGVGELVEQGSQEGVFGVAAVAAVAAANGDGGAAGSGSPDPGSSSKDSSKGSSKTSSAPSASPSRSASGGTSKTGSKSASPSQSAAKKS